MTTRQHSGTAPSSGTHHPDALGPDTDFPFPPAHLPHGAPALREHPGPAEGVRDHALTMSSAMKTSEPTARSANLPPFGHTDLFRRHLVRVTVVSRAGRSHRQGVLT
ncbi:hypothetical protein KBZ94_34850 [Streptomyces sp. RM72]|uniref:hypothetical protein n=1 Tax=Streptomyces sp. RM72 TaxID=1115510 RepID=UPI001B36CECF|nr:hypothetical protein [Streptomyces sp. RM72]MBQ0890047.1 hypothetical protein [Streptomyces sp. RM72]